MDDEKDTGRDAKGRFVKGQYKGGPGRLVRKPITLEEIENALQADLKSDDPRVRHSAYKIWVALSKIKVSNKPVQVNPELQALLAHVVGKFHDDEAEIIEDDDDDNNDD